MLMRTVTLSCCLLLAGATAWAPNVRAERPSPFDVAGRSNAHPSVAAAGSFVAVVWGATADGKTDVYLATSRDGGASFGAPVRVNRTPGEARLGGEMPPRVALVSTSASSLPEIAVLWTSRGEHTGIKTARSSDGGQTFHSPTALESAGAHGDRGWPALALDRAGTAHAVWLDYRGLAVRRATGPNHTAHHDPAHDGVAMAQNSGLYYAAANQGHVVERELT